MGRIVLLFDGFDELALRITYERATEHLDTLLEAVEGQAVGKHERAGLSTSGLTARFGPP